MADNKNKMLWELGLIDSGFTGGLDRATANVSNFGSKLTTAFKFVGGAAVLGYINSLVQKAGEIRDTADAMEVTSDSLQSMDYAAKQAGVSANTLQGAYQQLAGKAAELASGNAGVGKALEALNVNQAAFLKMPVDRQLEAIAKGYASADDKGKAFAAVADLIGQKNAPRLNAVLKQLGAEGLDSVINKAKEAGVVMSEEFIDRADQLGDRLDTLKTRVVTIGSTILNFAFDAADGWGALVGNVVNWAQGMETGYLTTEKAQTKLIAGLEEGIVVLKGTRATTEDIAKAEEARAKATHAANLEVLSGQGKINYLMDIAVALEAERKKWSDGTKEALRVESEIREAHVKLGNEIIKQEEERAKKSDELAKASRLSKDEQIERFVLETKGVKNLTEAERARYDQLALIGKQKAIHAQIDVLADKGIDNLTTKEKERLMQLIEQDGKLKGQITAKAVLVESAIAQARAEGKTTEELEKQLKILKGTVEEKAKLAGTLTTIGNPDNTRLSDKQLVEKIGNLRQVVALNNQDRAMGGWGDPFAGHAAVNLQRALIEQNQRQQFRQRVGVMGEDRALQFHSAFDEDRFKNYIRDSDNAEKTAKTLDKLDQRLSHLFPLHGR